MAWVVFLAPVDLGEAVLATGALAHALRAEDDLTVLAPPDTQPLFRSAPAAKICTPSEGAVAFGALARVQNLRCDLLIDGEGGLAGGVIPARRRMRLQPGPILRHRVEDWGEAAGAGRSLPPKLWLDDAARAAAAAWLGDARPLLVLAPGGVAPAKRWPAERFAAVARRLATGRMSGARILVLGAASRDAEITGAIVSSLDADGVSAQDLGVGLDLLGGAALMEQATLVIGNDNALTHIAAAMGAATLTVFGPTDERVRAPYGPRTRTLRGRSFEALAALRDADAAAAMQDVSIDAVEAAALDLLHAGGLR